MVAYPSILRIMHISATRQFGNKRPVYKANFPPSATTLEKNTRPFRALFCLNLRNTGETRTMTLL